MFGEEAVERAGYGGEEVEDLRRESPWRGIGQRRGILFVCGGGAVLAGGLCNLGL